MVQKRYQTTRAEYKTEPNKIAIKDLIRLFDECFLPRRNTYNSGNLFWTKKRIRDSGRLLAKIDRHRKRLRRRIIHLKNYDGNYRQEASRQTNEREKPDMKKTIEMINQNTCEKNNKITNIEYTLSPDHSSLTDASEPLHDSVVGPVEQKHLALVLGGSVGRSALGSSHERVRLPALRSQILHCSA